MKKKTVKAWAVVYDGDVDAVSTKQGALSHYAVFVRKSAADAYNREHDAFQRVVPCLITFEV